jgi:hypothetical protein
VPYALIDYLLEFDRHNVKVVRTAFGNSEPFSSERGTCPQGGDDSPYTFLGVQDVKNQLTNKLTHNPHQYTTGIPNPTTSIDLSGPNDKNICLFKTMYADDNSAYNQKWGVDGMQSYVNAAMLFFGFSGLKLNVDKPSVCWLQHSGNRAPAPNLYSLLQIHLMSESRRRPGCLHAIGGTSSQAWTWSLSA